jgi:uncharacterized protein (TIGR00661 family)
MKILYGIQLNGNGHITRSVELITKLKSSGYEVDVISSGNNSNLDLPFNHKHFDGFSIFFSDLGTIDWIKTIKNANLIKLIKDSMLDVTEYDLVISDFEPISAWSAKKCGVKSIGIANQYSLISDKTPKIKGFLSLKFIRNFAPCDEYIALSYKRFDYFIYQPFISDYFLKNKVRDNKFFLIYLPSYNLEFILKELSIFKQYKWRVYSNEEHSNDLKNIKIIKLNKEKFQKDLINCSGVITASGFSTTSEALILNKKMWSIPIQNQYEQLSNSLLLNQMGVFIDKFNSENLDIWLNHYKKVDYQWENPIDEILLKIKNIYES